MMRFDRIPFAQLTLIGATCVLLAGCPSNGSSATSGTSAVASVPAPSSGGASTVTSTGKTSSTGGSTSTTTSSTGGSPPTTPTPPPPPPSPPTTKSVTLSWVAPTLNTDGTILNDLAGYYVNYGTSATALTHSITVTGARSTTTTIGNLSSGTYYFSVTAYSSTGTASAPSPTVSTTI